MWLRENTTQNSQTVHQASTIIKVAFWERKHCDRQYNPYGKKRNIISLTFVKRLDDARDSFKPTARVQVHLENGTVLADIRFWSAEWTSDIAQGMTFAASASIFLKLGDGLTTTVFDHHVLGIDLDTDDPTFLLASNRVFDVCQ